MARLTPEEIAEIRALWSKGDLFLEKHKLCVFTVRRLLAHIDALEEELEDATEKLGMRAIFIDELKDERDAARAEIARLNGLEALDKFLARYAHENRPPSFKPGDLVDGMLGHQP